MAIVVGTQPSVESRPIGTPYQSAQGATLDVFGGAAAESLQRAGAQLGQGANQLAGIAIKNQLEDNERAGKDMDNKLSERIRLLTLGDGTEQNPGYYSQQGEAAVNGYGPTVEALQKSRDEILATAPNDRVRQQFKLASDDRLNTELGKITLHQNDGRRTALATTSKTRQDEALQNAAAHWNDPAVVNKSLGIQQGEVMTQARLQGWSAETTTSEMQRAVTMTYRAQILAAMKADPDAAQKIYDQVKGSVDGDVRIELEGMLESVTLASKSQEYAAQFLAEAGGDPTKARKLAEDALSGKQEDATVGRIDAKQQQMREDIRFSWAAQSHQEEQDNKKVAQFGLDEAKNIIGATGDISRAEAMTAAEKQDYSAKELDAVRKAINAHYEPIENEEQRQRAMLSSTNNEIDRAASIKEKADKEQSDNAIELFRSGVNQGGNMLDLQRQHPEEYAIASKRADFDDVKKVEKWNLQDAATATDWDYFDKVLRYGDAELSQYGVLQEARTKLASQQFTILQSRVEQVTGPNKKDAGTVATLQQEVDAKVNELGLTGKDNAEKRGKLQTMVYDEIAKAEEANGTKALSSEERTKLINSVVDPLVLKGGGFLGFFDSTTRPFEQAVPDEYKTAIVAAYKKHHNDAEPSQAEIARAYVKMKGNE